MSPVKTITCETMLVDLCAEDGSVTSHVLPAFTVPPSTLRSRILEIMDEYISRSEATKNEVSLADFALYLISHAENDPREMKVYDPLPSV